MDSLIILGKLLQRFKDKKKAQVKGYNSFGYIRETNNAVYITREDGQNTPIAFSKIVKGIDAYKKYPDLYNQGPIELRQFGITHVTSPIWSILHLLPIEEYQR